MEETPHPLLWLFPPLSRNAALGAFLPTSNMAARLRHRRDRGSGSGFRPLPKGPRRAGLRFRVRRCERKSSSRQDGGGVAVRAPGASPPAVAPAASKEAPGLNCGVLPCPRDPSRGRSFWGVSSADLLASLCPLTSGPLRTQKGYLL